MTYSEFLDAVLTLVRSSLPEDCTASLQSVIKNNDTKLDGLLIHKKGSNIAPTIYLNYYYETYCSGADLSEIVETILSVYEKSRPESDIDISFFTDYERVRGRIIYKLINYERNRALLSDIPHRRFLDLAVVFCCLLEETESGSATILIHNSHLAYWNVGEAELFDAAAENTPRLLSSEIEDMSTLMRELTSVEAIDAGRMFVLSNRLRLNGASTLLYSDLLSQFAEVFQCGFYVLPSSIHEVILMPGEPSEASDDLNRMVREINSTQVAADEILSDHVYYFDPRQRVLLM